MYEILSSLSQVVWSIWKELVEHRHIINKSKIYHQVFLSWKLDLDRIKRKKLGSIKNRNNVGEEKIMSDTA